MVAVASGKVLLTGASGYIGGWIVKDLVERNFEVLIAARSKTQINSIIKNFPAYANKISSVIVPVIEAPGAYDEAVKGVDGIIHAASPVVFDAEDPMDVIRPAVEGATGILKSAAKYGKNVKRVVLTSSAVAIVAEDQKEGVTYDENDWNKSSVAIVEAEGAKANGFTVYSASKTLAEQAAWDFIKTEKPSFDLTITLPVYNFGPFLNPISKEKGAPSSAGIFLSTFPVGGETSGKTVSSFVDVRDAALAHVLALSTPAAGGERIASASGNFAWQDLYDVLIDEGVTGVPGKDTYGKGRDAVKTPVYSNAKSLKLFPGFEYRGLQESVKEMSKELVAAGII